MKKTVQFTVIGHLEIDIQDDWEDEAIQDILYDMIESDWQNANDLYVDSIWVVE